MAQVNDSQIVQKVIAGEVPTAVGATALVDRQQCRLMSNEGQQLDYKQSVVLEDIRSIAELGRDILGFSNTDGGLLILGVADDHSLVGHDEIDFRRLRDSLGLFIGTRVDFDLEDVATSVAGKAHAPSEPQIRRAISYLHAVEHTEFAHLRVLGMLTEFYAILGDRKNYDKYLRFVTSYRETSGYIRDSHLDQLDEALARARSHFERRRG